MSRLSSRSRCGVTVPPMVRSSICFVGHPFRLVTTGREQCGERNTGQCANAVVMPASVPRPCRPAGSRSPPGSGARRPSPVQGSARPPKNCSQNRPRMLAATICGMTMKKLKMPIDTPIFFAGRLLDRSAYGSESIEAQAMPTPTIDTSSQARVVDEHGSDEADAADAQVQQVAAAADRARPRRRGLQWRRRPRSRCNTRTGHRPSPRRRCRRRTRCRSVP